MTHNRKAKILLGLDIAFGAKETARYRVSNNRVGFFDKATGQLVKTVKYK